MDDDERVREHERNDIAVAQQERGDRTRALDSVGELESEHGEEEPCHAGHHG